MLNRDHWMLQYEAANYNAGANIDGPYGDRRILGVRRRIYDIQLSCRMYLIGASTYFGGRKR